MADYIVGQGETFTSLEAIAADPTANSAGKTWYVKKDYDQPVTNVAVINATVEISFETGATVDVSAISAGVCLDGGTWVKPDIRRYSNTALTVVQNADLGNATVYTPLQDNALVNCTGDKCAITNLTGTAAGLTGTDNVWTANVAGVPGAYVVKNAEYHFDAVDDNVQFGILPDLYSPQLDELTLKTTIVTGPVATGTIFSIGAPSTSSLRMFQFYIFSNSINCFAGGSQTTASYTFLPNTRYDLVISVPAGASGVRIWINGVSITDSGAVGNTSFDAYTEIGSRTQGTGFLFNGIIGRMDIFRDYISTPDQVPQNLLLGVIRGDDWSDSVLLDNSGSGNDGTINGAKPVLSGLLTPLIGGSLLLPDGTYAGATQPVRYEQQRKRAGLRLGLRVGL